MHVQLNRSPTSACFCRFSGFDDDSAGDDGVSPSDDDSVEPALDDDAAVQDADDAVGIDR